MIFKVVIKKANSHFTDIHYMSPINLMCLISRINEDKEFKVGEKYYTPSEVESFRADKHYLSEVVEADEQEH